MEDYCGRDTATSGSVDRTCSMRHAFFSEKGVQGNRKTQSAIRAKRGEKIAEVNSYLLCSCLNFFVCFNHLQKKRNQFKIVTIQDNLIYLFSSWPLLLQNVFFVKVSNTGR